MNVIELQVRFHLAGVRSLKEKRQRLQGLRDKFGKQSGVAVCESDYADDLQRAQWSFVGVAAAAKPVQQMLDEIERYVSYSIDGQVVDIQRRVLAEPFRSMAEAESSTGTASS